MPPDIPPRHLNLGSLNFLSNSARHNRMNWRLLPSKLLKLSQLSQGFIEMLINGLCWVLLLDQRRSDIRQVRPDPLIIKLSRVGWRRLNIQVFSAPVIAISYRKQIKDYVNSCELVGWSVHIQVAKNALQWKDVLDGWGVHEHLLVDRTEDSWIFGMSVTNQKLHPFVFEFIINLDDFPNHIHSCSGILWLRHCLVKTLQNHSTDFLTESNIIDSHSMDDFG